MKEHKEGPAGEPPPYEQMIHVSIARQPPFFWGGASSCLSHKCQRMSRLGHQGKDPSLEGCRAACLFSLPLLSVQAGLRSEG